MGGNRTLKNKKQGGEMMQENSEKRAEGKLIVVDGTDGSGKATQTALLVERLKQEGFTVRSIDFPQYGNKSAGPLEEYLIGKYGTPEEVGPWIPSICYAFDRYDASFKIAKWISSGAIVVCDRYVSANIGHQGGKIRNKQERIKFLQWLDDLEYRLFGIPRPNITFILKTSPEISKQLSSQPEGEDKQRKRKVYLGTGKDRDIHDSNIEHLSQSLQSYLDAAEEFPEQFFVVECLDEKGGLKPREEIHEIVWQRVLQELR